MGKLDMILEKIGGIDERLDGMDKRFDAIDERLDGIDERLDGLETDLTKVKLIVENEIFPSIQRVAEGHLDLSRKLDEVKKDSNEFEMLSVRVSVLEANAIKQSKIS